LQSRNSGPPSFVFNAFCIGGERRLLFGHVSVQV
jgi:hypothetical protein